MENGQERVIRDGPEPIRDFKDLETWRFARQLRADVYRICRHLPKEETFGLTSQMRRAAVSVTANIAEGFGRYSYQENIQFCRQSRASVYELRDHFTTAQDAGYISNEGFASLEKLAISVIKPLNGYLRATKNREEVTRGKTG
jgi:four helix bundle protein